jgi:hypothetical protein
MKISEPWGKGLSGLQAVSRSRDPPVRVREWSGFMV